MRVSKEKMMEDYVTCDECGYNNKRDRFQAFGTCLHCGKILDKKVYFKVQMIKKAIRKGRIRGERVNERNLPF